MKKALIIIAIFALISPIWGKSYYSFLKPDKHGNKVKIQVMGKDRTYYKLDAKNPLEVTVEGPTVIKVLTRLDMSEYKESNKVDYKVYCQCNGKKTHFTCSAVISKGVEFSKSGEGKIGKGESFILKIKPGKQKIMLYLGKNDKKQIYVRLLKQSSQSSAKTERVAMHPQEFTTQVKILVKEKEYDYYRVGHEDSLALKIIGPATVKVLARLEYDITMNGGKKYRIGVYEDGEMKNTFVKSTRLSDVALYAGENSSLKLSRGDEFYIEVPEGEHTYTFKLPDNGGSLLLKFYLPVSALKNTP